MAKQPRKAQKWLRVISVVGLMAFVIQLYSMPGVAFEPVEPIEVESVLDIEPVTYLYFPLGTQLEEIVLPSTATVQLFTQDPVVESEAHTGESTSQPEEVQPEPDRESPPADGGEGGETQPSIPGPPPDGEEVPKEPEELPAEPGPEPPGPEPGEENLPSQTEETVELTPSVPLAGLSEEQVEPEETMEPAETTPPATPDVTAVPTGSAPPETLEGVLAPPISGQVEVPVTWECEGYDPDTEGEYTFTMQLPPEYVCANSMPVTIVTLVEAVPNIQPRSTSLDFFGGAEPSPGPSITDYFKVFAKDGTSGNGVHSKYDNVAVITPFLTDQQGGMWSLTRLDLNYYFAIEMEIYLGKPVGGRYPSGYGAGDGMTFTMHNDPDGEDAQNDYPNGRGEYLAIYGEGFVKNALAIEIDTYKNSWDPFTAIRGHVAIVQPNEERFMVQSSHIGAQSFDTIVSNGTIKSPFVDDWQPFNISWEPIERPGGVLGGKLSYEFGSTIKDEFVIDDITEYFGQDAKEEGVLWGFTGATGGAIGYQCAAIVNLPDQTLAVEVFDADGNPVGDGEAIEPGTTLTYTYKVLRTNTPPPGFNDAISLIVEDTLPWQVEYVPGSARLQTSKNATPQSITPAVTGNTYSFEMGDELTVPGDWVTVSYDAVVFPYAAGTTIENTATLYDRHTRDEIALSNQVNTAVRATTELYGSVNFLGPLYPSSTSAYFLMVDLWGQMNGNNPQNMVLDIQLGPYTRLENLALLTANSALRGSEDWINLDIQPTVEDDRLQLKLPTMDTNRMYRLFIPVEILKDYAGARLHKNPTLGSNPQAGEDGVILLGQTTLSATGISPVELEVPVRYREGSSATLNVTKVSSRGVGDTPLAEVPFHLYYEDAASKKWYFAPDVAGRWTDDPAKAQRLETGANGNLIIENLPYNTYYMQELVAPQDHLLPETPFTIEVQDANAPDAANPVTTVINQTLVNQLATTPFIFQTVFGEDDLPLNGTKFALYQLVCEETDMAHNHDLYVGGPGDCWGNHAEAEGVNDGMVDFGEIPYGTYQLVQISTHAQRELPSGQWLFTFATDTMDIQAVGTPPAFKIGTWANGETGLQLPNYPKAVLPLAGGPEQMARTFSLLALCAVAMGAMLLAGSRRNKMKQRMQRIQYKLSQNRIQPPIFKEDTTE